MKSPQATYEGFLSIRKFGPLDGLRGVAVLFIVWFHTSGQPGPLIFSQGQAALECFFAISGFLITTLLMRERNKSGRISLRRFYIRRVLRIFPLYYTMVAIYIVVMLVMENGTEKGQQFFSHLPGFLTFTSNWQIGLGQSETVPFYFAWSLATEEQYYLLWPPLLVASLLVSKGRIWGPLAVLLGLVTILVATHVFADPQQMPWRIPASLSLSILLASACAVIVNDPRGFAVMAWVLGRRWSAPVVYIILLTVLSLGTWPWLIEVLVVPAVVSVSIVDRTLLRPILAWRPLVFVGVVSYGMYLTHMLSANVVRRVIHEQESVTVAIGTIALAILAGYLSFRFFETPILRLKRRFENVDQKAGDELSRR